MNVRPNAEHCCSQPNVDACLLGGRSGRRSPQRVGRFIPRRVVRRQPGILVEPFAYRGVAAWRVAPRVAPARSAPLEKMVNFSSRYARILSKIGALRAILVKSARYARSNLASGALRASQHSLTEVGVKWFFLQCGRWGAVTRGTIYASSQKN